MTSYQRKYEHLASVCDSLAQNASAPEEREHLLDLAHQWRAMATNPKIYEVPPRDAHRCRGHRLAEGDSIVRLSPVNQWRGNRHLGADSGSAVLC